MPLPEIDTCNEADYLDETAAGASRTMLWDYGFAGTAQRCQKILVGQKVQWIGSFPEHPLDQDEGARPNPIPGHDAAGFVTFTTPGVFGYRCNTHFEMRGAIWVVAAPAAPSVPWSPGAGLSALATVLLIAGLWRARRARRRAAPRA